ncbi:MAG: hypothetical protein MJZ05_01935 [Fibrobacter sp.]|nr:hypothetical protein [Fibrobacter sp.]
MFLGCISVCGDNFCSGPPSNCKVELILYSRIEFLSNLGILIVVKTALEKDNTKQAQEIRQLKTELQQAYEKLHMEKIARECAEYNLEQARAQAGNQLNLNAPTDQEMYPGEYMGYIICALKVMLKGTNKSANSTRIRSADVLKAILEANPQADDSYNELTGKLKDLRQFANQQALATPKGKNETSYLLHALFPSENKV